jgi:hypothetical protein
MENLSEKEFRNNRVIDMHNSGSTIKEIISATGLSKSGIYKIIDGIIKVGDAPAKRVKEVEITGDEERFDNFTGWTRTNTTEIMNEKTGEFVRIAFVKAKSKDEFGYFVKLLI